MTHDGGARLSFWGATDTVTGSRYLLEHGGQRILVDCGLFQGYKKLRERNRAPLPLAPSSIDAVVLTHAHLDHSGYVPALVRDGFRGPVYATPGTAELCTLLLPDSGHLLEEEAETARLRGSSRHHPPRPLYTATDAVEALRSFRPHPFREPLEIGDGISVRFVPAGHILGASQVRVALGAGGSELTVHFTGDLGRRDDPLMNPPEQLEPAQVLVAESTYGDRAHPAESAEDALGDVVRRVAKLGGVVVIAAFAVGRAETLMLHLARLRRKGKIPDIPVYLNSPMAVDASEMYRDHRDEHRIDEREFREMYNLPTMVREPDDSKLLNLRGGPMVIISASGMLTGGRVLHHVEAYGGEAKNAIVLSGYQAGGTRGASLLDGAGSLRIYGRDVPIRAEVVSLENLSAHADADEILRWMGACSTAPRMVYVTHGEPEASDALRRRIQHELGWRARVPEHLEQVDLADPR
ncbi:MBL fold metallo-hydrolase RNA specificity domain-containing protein [Sinomonas sp. R1AF57]|uniref:MBL fold metallo-hydrolase RNA specificity domain-containing protein n=1 Tax=Sinomonas sp. R1AF57 TaxID=2020377 RepID=UPI000B61093D|nr:MBL fold metallo-hydrolase [Sinomonas sp. R1AF57]ASN53214.1 MBL fold metallo-hydrolase [Sinomonas sp. R1AF57]